MTLPVPTERYKHHCFPGEIISHGVWLYYRFPQAAHRRLRAEDKWLRRARDMVKNALRCVVNDPK